jgi:hypothetical protein
MARLINPGVGDTLDRLTILALKVVYGTHRGRDVTAFVSERDALIGALIEQIQGMPPMPAENGLAILFELGAINAALWQAEDELRALRTEQELDQASGSLREVVECAYRIQALNDRRAEMIERLNRRAGDKRGPEKL